MRISSDYKLYVYEHACMRNVSKGKTIMCSAAAEEGGTTSTYFAASAQAGRVVS